MKSKIHILLLCFLWSCQNPSSTVTPIKEGQPDKLTETATVAVQETQTVPSPKNLPSLSEGLPEGVSIVEENLLFQFEDLSNVEPGAYIAYETGEERSYSDYIPQDFNFRLMSLDAKRDYPLFACEGCPYELRGFDAYSNEKYFLTDYEYGNWDCKGIIVDIKKQTAKRIRLDLSQTLPVSPHHFCLSSSGAPATWAYRFQPISPNGDWWLFATSSAEKEDASRPDLPQNLLLYAVESGEWLTLDIGKLITGVLWTPNNYLIVEVRDESCGGKVGAYLISTSTYQIQDLSPFLCGFDRPSPRIRGWTPDGSQVVLVWDIYNNAMELNFASVAQISVCPSETLNSLDAKQCRLVSDTLTQKVANTIHAYSITNEGVLVTAPTSDDVSLYYLVRFNGELDYGGAYKNAKGFIRDIAIERGDLLLITGENRNLVGVTNIKDITNVTLLPIKVKYLVDAFFVDIK